MTDTDDSSDRMSASSGVILDLDGTLVDSVHQHVLAWRQALLARDHDVSQAEGVDCDGSWAQPWTIKCQQATLKSWTQEQP